MNKAGQRSSECLNTVTFSRTGWRRVSKTQRDKIVSSCSDAFQVQHKPPKHKHLTLRHPEKMVWIFFFSCSLSPSCHPSLGPDNAESPNSSSSCFQRKRDHVATGSLNFPGKVHLHAETLASRLPSLLQDYGAGDQRKELTRQG